MKIVIGESESKYLTIVSISPEDHIQWCVIRSRCLQVGQHAVAEIQTSNLACLQVDQHVVAEIQTAICQLNNN